MRSRQTVVARFHRRRYARCPIDVVMLVAVGVAVCFAFYMGWIHPCGFPGAL